MSTPTMSQLSTHLTESEIDALSQRQIKKHHVAIILLHWFNAITWMLLLVTGAALISSPYFRFAPLWYVRIVEGFLGTRANMLHFHIALGLVWTAVFLVYGTFGFRTYLRKEVVQKEIGLDWDDVVWLFVRVRNILRGRNDELPPPLCVFHLHSVLMVSQDQAATRRLLAAEARTFQSLGEDMQNHALKHEAVRHHLSTNAEQEAAVTGLSFLVGRRNLFAPWRIE